MTQDCSLSSSTASVKVYDNKLLPKGIHIIGADNASASKVKRISAGDEDDKPWSYIFIQHMVAERFDQKLNEKKLEGDFKPKCFIHRTINYKRKPNGKGILKEEKPTISGLVFLQGEVDELVTFLRRNYPQYHLVRNCMTGAPASIKNSLMRPFMEVMESEPSRISFLHDPFVKFAKEHVKLRVLTGIFAGQEGYVIRINRDRNLLMDFGGYTVAIRNVHKENFEVAE